MIGNVYWGAEPQYRDPRLTIKLIVGNYALSVIMHFIKNFLSARPSMNSIWIAYKRFYISLGSTLTSFFSCLTFGEP